VGYLKAGFLFVFAVPSPLEADAVWCRPLWGVSGFARARVTTPTLRHCGRGLRPYPQSGSASLPCVIAGLTRNLMRSQKHVGLCPSEGNDPTPPCVIADLIRNLMRSVVVKKILNNCRFTESPIMSLNKQPHRRGDRANKLALWSPCAVKFRLHFGKQNNETPSLRERPPTGQSPVAIQKLIKLLPLPSPPPLRERMVCEANTVRGRCF
jgi:hypothetical protein